MKRLLAIIGVVLLLNGCSVGENEIDAVLSLRKQLEMGSSCEFDAIITADYTEEVYSFAMKCRQESGGDLCFTVTQPQSIAQISGSVSELGGRLSFEDNVLAFEMLADGVLSPISGPWILMRTIRGGYIQGASRSDNITCTQIDDSFRGKNLQVSLWTDAENQPLSAEILYDGKRILSIAVENFKIV